MLTTTKDVPLHPVAVHRGPSPGIVAIAYTALFMSGMVATIILTNGAAYPIPTGSIDVAHHYFLQFTDAVRLTSFFQFGSAIPLGIFTAAITSRLRFLGVKESGVHIAMFGGFSASLLMAIMGLTGWMLSQPGVADDVSTMHAFQLFGFAAGGPGHIVTLGLLLAVFQYPRFYTG